LKGGGRKLARILHGVLGVLRVASGALTGTDSEPGPAL
jgi:hypothetical protein